MTRPQCPNALGRRPVADAALAGALCILAVGGLATGQVDEHPLAVTVPIAIVSTLVIAVRTRFPLAVAGIISVLAVTQSLATGSASNTLWALMVFLVAAYTVAAESDEGRAIAGLCVVLGGQFLCELLEHGSDYAFDTLVFGGAWLLGRGTRSWRDRATYAERHRQDLARIAVAEERTRIARELHDVVAHSLSVIAVQADAAEAALAKAPDRAGPPMRAIRDSARDALVDMRQLLHVLRAAPDTDDGADADQLAPTRGIADLPQLVTTMRESGLPLVADIRVDGPVPSGSGLAAYRIAQEGLTNARRHAGAVPTRLRVVKDDTSLTVEVHNEGPAAAHTPVAVWSSGHGLVGIRERVRAAGGTLQLGPTSSGGFSLVARLPLQTRRGAER